MQKYYLISFRKENSTITTKMILRDIEPQHWFDAQKDISFFRFRALTQTELDDFEDILPMVTAEEFYDATLTKKYYFVCATELENNNKCIINLLLDIHPIKWMHTKLKENKQIVLNNWQEISKSEYKQFKGYL